MMSGTSWSFSRKTCPANLSVLYLSISLCFYYRMVHILNNLDSTPKTAKSISTSKFYLKNKLMSHFLRT